MSQIVVDTDVASYISNWHTLAQQYVNALRGSDLILSFMSVAELRMGAMSVGWGSQRRLLLERFIHGFELFYSDDDLCTVWARIRADARAAGRAISPQDAWIAATALALDALSRRTIAGILRTFGMCGCCLCNDQARGDRPGTGIVRNRLDSIP